MITEKLTKSSKGFTIIELIISIFILSVAVVGIFSAFSVITILTSDSADRLTGTYLAQEGMEIVRNIRDINWLNMDACAACTTSCPEFCPATWVDGLSPNCITSTGGCEADYTTGTKMTNPWAMHSWASRPLLNSDGFYNYTSGSTTKFKRRITIDPVQDVPVNGVADNKKHIIKAKVEVSWTEKGTILNPVGAVAGICGLSNCITAEDTLYDWYNYNFQ